MPVIIEEFTSDPIINYETVEGVETVDAREAPVVVEPLANIPLGKSTLFKSTYHVNGNTEDRLCFVVRAPNVSFAIAATNYYIYSRFPEAGTLEFMFAEPVDGLGVNDIDIGYYYYWR